MQKPEKKAVAYLKKHNVLTLATTEGKVPYCATMTYAYLEESVGFVFTSHDETRHVSEVKKNPVVAGNIVQDLRTFTRVQGLQFTGRMYRPQGETLSKAKKAYLVRYPLAVVADLDLWVVEMDWFKFTNNLMGVPSLTVWRRDEGTTDMTPAE